MIDHKDRNRGNNHEDNLHYITVSDNMKDREITRYERHRGIPNETELEEMYFSEPHLIFKDFCALSGG